MKSKLNTLKLLALAILAISLFGCKKQTSTESYYKTMSADQIYAQAQNNMATNKYPQAVKDFEALEARYPYSGYADKAQIGLMTAYHKRGEYPQALATINRFIRMNPHHSQIDYVYYLKGMVYADQNMSFMYRHLPLDRSARDPAYAQEGYNTFQELLERFPNSKYASEAKKRSIEFRNQMAANELSVISYYMRREAYVSAVNRASHIVKHYKGTTAVPQALAEMGKAYRKLGMKSLELETIKTLRAQYPNSEALKKLS